MGLKHKPCVQQGTAYAQMKKGVVGVPGSGLPTSCQVSEDFAEVSGFLPNTPLPKCKMWYTSILPRHEREEGGEWFLTVGYVQVHLAIFGHLFIWL